MRRHTRSQSVDSIDQLEVAPVVAPSVKGRKKGARTPSAPSSPVVDSFSDAQEYQVTPASAMRALRDNTEALADLAASGEVNPDQRSALIHDIIHNVNVAASPAKPATAYAPATGPAPLSPIQSGVTYDPQPSFKETSHTPTTHQLTGPQGTSFMATPQSVYQELLPSGVQRQEGHAEPYTTARFCPTHWLQPFSWLPSL